MRTILSCCVLLLLLLAVSQATVVPHVGPIVTHAPLTYKVNLQDSPLVRWAPLVRDYNESLQHFVHFLDELPIPAQFYDGVEWFAKNEFIHKDFVAQVDALSKLSGVNFDKIFFLNFFYEFSTFKACTGLLVRNSEGKVMHGRNLDFEMWSILSKMLANVEYYKGGKLVYSVDTIVGSVFALTGIRYGAFAINIDTRKQKNFEEDLISVLVDNGMPTPWLVRRVLEEETDYESAVRRLKSVRIGGPVYYIVSGVGPNEGIVIERDPDAVHAYYELSDTVWFLVQTNYDRDQPEPLHDPRRIPLEKKLQQRGNTGLQEKEVMTEFMSQWPNFNIATIMTAVMTPATPYHNVTVWYGENPVRQQHLTAM